MAAKIVDLASDGSTWDFGNRMHSEHKVKTYYSVIYCIVGEPFPETSSQRPSHFIKH